MRALATAACVLLMLSAGCTGLLNSDPTPTPTPTITQTETPTSTDTESPESTATSIPTTDEPTPEPTETETPEPRPNNPWRSEVVNVTIVNEDFTDRDYSGPMKDAIEYWNGGTAANHSSNDITLAYTENASLGEADIEVSLVDSIPACGYEIESALETYLGCATGSDEIEILANQSNLQFRNTATHEIGHTIGLEHGDDPRWVMSIGENGEDVKNASERTNPWNTTGPLKVAVGESIEDQDRVQSEVEDAVNYYNNNEHYLPDEMELKAVDKWYNAHILIQDSSQTTRPFTGPDYSATSVTAGLDVDEDDSAEKYVSASVYLHKVDADESEWHVGHWIGRLLGHNEDDVPRKYEP